MLWIGLFGAAMCEQTMRLSINGRTRDGLGVPISPHLFRDCAATTLAIEDPAHVGVAAPLLGHASYRTTDRHYRQASSIEASRRHLAVLADLRAQLGAAPTPRPSRRRDLPLLTALRRDRP